MSAPEVYTIDGYRVTVRRFESPTAPGEQWEVARPNGTRIGAGRTRADAERIVDQDWRWRRMVAPTTTRKEAAA